MLKCNNHLGYHCNNNLKKVYPRGATYMSKCPHVHMSICPHVHMSTCPHGHIDVWTCGHVDMWTLRHMDIMEKDNSSSYSWQIFSH